MGEEDISEGQESLLATDDDPDGRPMFPEKGNREIQVEEESGNRGESKQKSQTGNTLGIQGKGSQEGYIR